MTTPTRRYILASLAEATRGHAPRFAYSYSTQNLADLRNLSAAASQLVTEFTSIREHQLTAREQLMRNMQNAQESYRADRLARFAEMFKSDSRNQEEAVRALQKKHGSDADISDAQILYYLDTKLKTGELEKEKKRIDAMTDDQFEKEVLSTTKGQIANLQRRVANIALAREAVHVLDATIENGISIAEVLKSRADRKALDASRIVDAKEILKGTELLKVQGERSLQDLSRHLGAMKESVVGDLGRMVSSWIGSLAAKFRSMFEHSKILLKKAKSL